jgi:hypothetical protein
MDKFKELTTGAKLVLGATIAFLIVSIFEWFELGGELGEAIDELAGDNGVSMWNGIGWLAGLLAIALIVWQAIRLANIELEIGVTPAMITAGLAALLLIFTVIRFIDAPTGFDRTFWAWLGLALAIVIAVGAWMNMQASGESLADIRSSLAGAAASAKGDRDDAPPAAPPAAPAPPAEPPAATTVEPPAAPPADASPEPDQGDEPPRAS